MISFLLNLTAPWGRSHRIWHEVLPRGCWLLVHQEAETPLPPQQQATPAGPLASQLSQHAVRWDLAGLCWPRGRVLTWPLKEDTGQRPGSLELTRVMKVLPHCRPFLGAAAATVPSRAGFPRSGLSWQGHREGPGASGRWWWSRGLTSQSQPSRVLAVRLWRRHPHPREPPPPPAVPPAIRAAPRPAAPPTTGTATKSSRHRVGVPKEDPTHRSDSRNSLGRWSPEALGRRGEARQEEREAVTGGVGRSPPRAVQPQPRGLCQRVRNTPASPHGRPRSLGFPAPTAGCSWGVKAPGCPTGLVRGPSMALGPENPVGQRCGKPWVRLGTPAPAEGWGGQGPLCRLTGRRKAACGDTEESRAFSSWPWLQGSCPPPGWRTGVLAGLSQP